MTVFSEKNPIFTPKISDDFFSVIDQVFPIVRIFIVLNVIYDYMTLSLQENHYFRKEFLDNTLSFTLFVLSRASDNTSLLL